MVLTYLPFEKDTKLTQRRGNRRTFEGGCGSWQDGKGFVREGGVRTRTAVVRINVDRVIV